MSELRITRAEDPLDFQLEGFKTYASVPDGSVDAMLMGILKRAMLAVQEHSDKAMLPCEIELTVHDVRPGDIIPLYQGGDEVVSVRDASGADVAHTPGKGRVVIGQRASDVTVTYTNRVSLPDAGKLMPVCVELATAIYDGEEASRQASILNKTHWAL